LIISAQPEHAADLTRITISAKRHWGYPESWMQHWLPSLTITAGYIETHETWMLLVEGLPVGYYSFSQSEDAWWLDNLWVLPEYMGRGLGKALFQHALERCGTLGIFKLNIEADPNAQSFYEKMGARKVHEHHSELDGTPRILPIMEINL
jgi:GNAT superfamily N-acetyltransferase